MSRYSSVVNELVDSLAFGVDVARWFATLLIVLLGAIFALVHAVTLTPLDAIPEEMMVDLVVSAAYGLTIGIGVMFLVATVLSLLEKAWTEVTT